MPNLRITKSPVAVTLVAILTAVGMVGLSPASASCRNSNRLASGATIGSQVDGEIVTICLSKEQLRKLRGSAKPTPKPAVRATIRPIPLAKPTPKKTAIPAVKSKVRVIYQPRPAAKPKPKPRVTKRGLNSNGSFRPTVRPAFAVPERVKPNQAVSLSIAQHTALGKTRLLGSSVLVRMTPVGLDFSFGDGDSQQVEGASTIAAHRYSKAGRYPILVHVTYRVEYRLKTGRWFRDPDSIVLAAPSNFVEVSYSSAQNPMQKVVLVTP